MSDFILKSLLCIMFVYVLVTQFIISGYEMEINRMFKVNTALLGSCVLLTEGDDLNERYVEK